MRAITLTICYILTLACLEGSIAWLIKAIQGERHYYISFIFGVLVTLFFYSQIKQTKKEKI